MDFLRSQLRLSLIVDIEIARKGESGPQWTDLAEAGVTSLFLRTGGGHRSAADLGTLVRLTDLWRARGGYVFAMDDAVLALRLGCHGVFLRNPRQSLSRLREVLGAERFLGLEVNSATALGRVHGSEGEHVDFVGVGPVLQYGDKVAMPLGVESALRLTRGVGGRPVFWTGGIRPEDVESFGPGFADGVAVVRSLIPPCAPQPPDFAAVVAQVLKLHTALGAVLGPSQWSVGHPPIDPNFHFSKLSSDDLRAQSIPYARRHA
jgi:thiamine monophosphate synthase